jgi:hypothetical protein
MQTKNTEFCVLARTIALSKGSSLYSHMITISAEVHKTALSVHNHIQFHRSAGLFSNSFQSITAKSILSISYGVISDLSCL